MQRAGALVTDALEPFPLQAFHQPCFLPLPLGLSPASDSQIWALPAWLGCSYSHNQHSAPSHGGRASMDPGLWPGSQGFFINDQFC